MGFIENNLMQDEQVTYEAQLHPIVFWAPIALFILGIACLLLPLEQTQNQWLSEHAWGVRIGLMLFFWLVAVVRAIEVHGGKRYVVTNRRLIFKRGIVRRHSHELLLRKCEGVQTEQTIIGRMLGYGSVSVTTGEVTNTYDYIRNPMRFSTMINQTIDLLNRDKTE
ncbi:MAG: PH domain-containing protein [Bacteroidaceae bacterium]|jgi:uncharacterized membrane protein YdbT with pleckstrin-like domain|nr:PH domain-containing protein [Bacteroidaceae bacterium]